MGGGGFTMEPDNPLLDDYVLSQSPVKNPKICFVPTASGDNWGYIEEFYEHFTSRHCIPTHLALTRPPTRDIESFLLENDIIYVGGGHTGKMLDQWNHYDLDHYLKEAWDMGILLAGVSAGASCWFETGLTDSIPGQLTGEPCLGFLKGSHCAHFDNNGRQPTFLRLILEGAPEPGFGTENFAALHFVGNNLERVVGSRPGVAAYRIYRNLGTIVEEKLEAVWLGR